MLFGRSSSMPLKHAGEAGAGHGAAVGVQEYLGSGGLAPNRQPRAKRMPYFSPKGQGSIFSTFSLDVDVNVAAFKVNGIFPESDQFRHAQPASQRQVQHGAIPDAKSRSRVRYVQYCAALLAVQGLHERALRALRGNCQDSSDLIEKCRRAVLDEPHEGLNCCEPRISRTGGGVAIPLEMLEEIENNLGVEAFYNEVRRRQLEFFTGELEQELECVSVRSACMWAQAPFDGETRLQERGDMGRYRRHDVTPSTTGRQRSARSLIN